MSRSILDARQITLRQFLQQIANSSTYAGTADAKPANQSELDNLLKAIDDELTPLLRLSANDPTSLIVNVGAAVIANSESARNRSIPHIGALLPNSFTSGTVTFPATSGGTITVSPGNNGILTVSSGNYIKVLIYMDATGALNVLPGVENAVEANATVLAAPKKTLPIGYITLQNVAGVIQNVAQNKIYQFGTGSGGSGSGTGSGVGDDLTALTFKASFLDEFDDIPSGSASAVDIGAGKTDSTTYSAANAYYRIAYDASKTVTGTGTSMTLSGAPSFTVKVGDVLRVGSEVKRITVVTSQVLYTLESAFTSDPSAAAATVSQAVYTQDLNNLALDGSAISSAFSDNLSQILVDYEDTTSIDDIIFDINTVPVIAYSASSDGTSYSNAQVRVTNTTDSALMVDLPSSGTNLYIRFFSNKTTGSGFVNILKYKAFLHRDSAVADGSILNQAYCMTDGSGTEINCSAPTVVSGKTRIQTSFNFPVGVNAGTTNGSISVYINGQKIPRFIDGTLTPNASYKEINQNTIELDTDYSSYAYEVEIVQDVAVIDNLDINSSNITSLQEVQQKGFQPFYDQSENLSPTTTVGSPTAGLFYSSINNRTLILNLSANLQPNFGIERIPTQQLFQLQNEYGPNGEAVFGALNDNANLIRFVGAGWSNLNDTHGPRVSTSSTNQSDYVEITFYGTGLNIMSFPESSFPPDVKWSVNGGSETSILNAAQSLILEGRNYSTNTLTPVVAGLSLGVYTVKLRKNATNVGSFGVYGFEVLNESSTIKVNPGSSFVNGKKLVSNSQQSLSYNSSFESGTLGTRGGRVLVYQKADGSIAKSLTPTDASQLNLSSANHSNEEISRVHHWREFGAGRSDDFSIIPNGAGNSQLYFTLDDGTATLLGGSVAVPAANNGTGIGFNATGSALTLTFIGTGLDIIANKASGGGVFTFNTIIDGNASVGNIVETNFPTALMDTRIKIVSGLPYGTHTVRLLVSGTYSLNMVVKQFVVYQPKKPTLPSGAMEIADYNILGDYSVAAAGFSTVASGVMRKQNIREFTYSGSWSANADAGSEFYISGWQIYTTTNSDYIEYTFFGTGFEVRGRGLTTNSATNTVALQNLSTGGSLLTLNSTNFPGLTTSSIGGWTYTYSSGNLDEAASNTVGSGFAVTGLSLGLYKIRITNGTSNPMMLETIDIVTPIHVQKSNLHSTIQNTLTIGSNSLSDVRNETVIKENYLQKKNVAQAFGVASSPSTTSTIPVPLQDMSVTHYNESGRIKISGQLEFNTSGSVAVNLYMYVDGVQVPVVFQTAANLYYAQLCGFYIIEVPAGFHKIDLFWSVSSGTAAASATYRSLLVEEI